MHNEGQNLEGYKYKVWEGFGHLSGYREEERVHIRGGEAGSPAPCWMQAAQQVFFTLGCR
jgi:hypothetical protein